MFKLRYANFLQLVTEASSKLQTTADNIWNWTTKRRIGLNETYVGLIYKNESEDDDNGKNDQIITRVNPEMEAKQKKEKNLILNFLNVLV